MGPSPTTFSITPLKNGNMRRRGSFSFDVVFESNRKGFVVQYLRKILTYKKSVNSLVKNYNYSYWEIFYIDGGGKSRNTDRFAQNPLEQYSEGSLIQIGYAYFFPYDEPVTQKNQVIELTGPIKEIFGSGVEPGVIEYANGLPSSKHQPEMNTLTPVPLVIIHKLTVNWGKHENLSKLTNKGWKSIVDEEVFAGYYQIFPWGFKGQRPLLKDDNWAGGAGDWKLQKPIKNR